MNFFVALLPPFEGAIFAIRHSPLETVNSKSAKGEHNMTTTVDARGLACPQPVILTKKALAEADEVISIVDNEISRQNVSKMAARQGFAVTVEEREDGFYLHLRREAKAAAETSAAVASAPSPAPGGGPLVVTIPADVMGRGNDELGRVLIRAFLHTLNEVSPLPDRIIFFNTGVRLVTQDSPVLEDVRNLAEQGVDIVACGTCVDFLGLKGQIAVGEISNMYSIAEMLFEAGKVVSL